MDLESLWGTIYRRFDHKEPPVRPEWRVHRTKKQLFDLHRRLNVPFDETAKFLLAGTMGTGKSTELARLAEARKERAFVISFDVRRHLADVVGESAALNRLEPWEMVLFVGLAVARACQEAYPEGWKPELLDALGKAWSAFLPSDAPGIRLGQLIKTVAVAFSTVLDGGAVLATTASASGALDWTVKLGRRKQRSTDQDPKVRQVVHVVSIILEDARRLSGKPVLYLLDGLDRLATDDDRARAEALLVRSELMQRLPCRMVVLAPFALRFDPLFAETPGFTKVVLVNEPVLDMQAPAEPDRLGPGIAFFRDLFAARTADLVADASTLLDESGLRRLAWSSGGRARDFVEFVRVAAGYAYSKGSDHITAEIVDAVLDERRRLLETGIFAPDVEVLRAARDAPRAPLPRNDAVTRMLATGRLLPYPNDSEWFFPHPLLLPYLGRA